MSTNLGETSAFPINEDGSVSRGITLRQYYIAKALQGMLANPHCMGDPSITDSRLPETAIWYADVLLAMEQNQD